jgi:hypothetical protein
MKITVTEALRLKNEIAETVNKLNYATNTAQLGVIKEDGEVISEPKDTFNSVFERLKKALGFSAEINNVLANFNKETGIDGKVRAMHNEKMLFNILTSALPKTKPTTHSKFENLGNGQRKSVKVDYVPNVNSKEIKDGMAEAKNKMRSLQVEVEKLNQREIELSFEHSDIESLIE